MRQMIVDEAQLFAREVSIDERGGVVHRKMRRRFYRLFEDLRSQAKEPRVTISDGFNLSPTYVAGDEVVAYRKHLRKG